jgi:hypothetical protein
MNFDRVIMACLLTGLFCGTSDLAIAKKSTRSCVQKPVHITYSPNTEWMAVLHYRPCGSVYITQDVPYEGLTVMVAENSEVFMGQKGTSFTNFLPAHTFVGSNGLNINCYGVGLNGFCNPN